MKKSVVFGLTDFAAMIRNLVELYTDTRIEAYIVDRKYMTETQFDGLPVVAFEDVEEKFPKEEYSFFVGLGYSKMNNLRKQKFLEIKEKGYYVENFVHPHAVREPSFQLGEGNLIFENVVLGYNAKIGNCNIIWNSCNISHECQVGDYNHFSGSTTLGGKTFIKNNCFFGMGSIIRGARVIEDYTLVGAGCFVNVNTQPYSVHVPARSTCLENKKSIDLM